MPAFPDLPDLADEPFLPAPAVGSWPTVADDPALVLLDEEFAAGAALALTVAEPRLPVEDSVAAAASVDSATLSVVTLAARRDDAVLRAFRVVTDSVTVLAAVGAAAAAPVAAAVGGVGVMASAMTSRS